MTSFRRVALCALCAPLASTLAFSSGAAAQNWSFDARAIALGSTSTANIAVDMVNAERPYRPIVLPFGLIQVLGDIDRFNPESDDFDIVRAVEYTASPLHFVVDRDQGDTGTEFVNDITNLRLDRDLNDGSRPAARPTVSMSA